MSNDSTVGGAQPPQLDKDVVGPPSDLGPSEWAQSTEAALDKTEGAAPRDTVAANAPETPGVQVPGGWNDSPASGAQQVVKDATDALAAAGQTAFGVLPQGVKDSLSSQPSTASGSAVPQKASEAATSASETVANAATTVTATATAVASGVYNTLFGSNAPAEQPDKNAEVQPAQATATLPSQDKAGQLPYTQTGGAGSLPGNADETGVAVLPEEKTNVGDAHIPVATQSTVQHQATVSEKVAGAGIATGGALSNAADQASQLANQAASSAANAASNTASQLPGAPKTLSDDLGETRPVHESRTLPTQDKLGQQPFSGPQGGVGALPGDAQEEAVALLPEEKANPDPISASSNHSSDNASASTKKPSVMDKVKGQAKIISGKLANNDEKIAEGKALKSGQP